MEMKNRKLAAEIAEERMSMIAPLLSQNMDSRRVEQLRQEICERNQISQRTLERYLCAYLNGGFEALKAAKVTTKFHKSYWMRQSSYAGNFPAGASLQLLKSWSWRRRLLPDF